MVLNMSNKQEVLWSDTNPREDLDYLQNLWKPAVGHSVFNMSAFVRQRIMKIVEGYEAQVVLSGSNEIDWMQELSWHPEVPELEELLIRMGFGFTEDSVFFKTLSLGRPRTISDFANVVRTTRHFAALKSLPDPIS